MTSKTLILPANPDALGLLQGLTLLLANGFELPVDVTLQICCVDTLQSPDVVITEAGMKCCADNYRSTYEALSAMGATPPTPPFTVTCFDCEPLRLPPECHQLVEAMWPTCDALRAATLQAIMALEGKMKSLIDEADVVTFARLEDIDAMALVYALTAVVPRERLTVVLEISEQESTCLTPLTALTLQRLERSARFVLTGRRDDAYRTGFTTMRSLASVAEGLASPIVGEPKLPAEHDTLAYSMEHLPSKAVARALYAASLKQELIRLTVSKELSPWRRNMQAGSGVDVWSDEGIVEQFMACDDYLSLLQERIPSSDFDFAADDASIANSIQEMNGALALKSDSLNAVRRETRCRTLFTAISKAAGEWADRKFKTSNYYSSQAKSYVVGIKADEFFRTKFSALPCPPLFMFDVCDLAFDNAFNKDPQARLWRSYCLDFWQMFYRNQSSEIESLFTVEEARLSGLPLSAFHKLLASTSCGRIMLQQDVYYTLTNRSSHRRAFSSPLTGFAAVPIDTNNVVDLANRESDFREFMLVYCEKVGASLSKRFREYVKQSVGSGLAAAQAKGGNIVAHYESFRTHVGIDY